MKKLLFLLLAGTLSAQGVGINTTTPTAKLDVNGDLRVRQVPTGLASDSILVVRNGFVKKIALSSLLPTQQCPTFLKPQSNAFYIRFSSSSSIPGAGSNLIIDGKVFVPAATWFDNNLYYSSWTNVSGLPLNINNFSVNFNGQTCNYQ